MTMLTKEEKEKVHHLILKRVGEVKEEITDFEEMTKPVSPDNAIGRVSRMDAINNNSVTEAALRHAPPGVKKFRSRPSFVL
jgi:DnaK suppressor protein